MVRAFLRAVSRFMATLPRHSTVSTLSKRNEVMGPCRVLRPSGGRESGLRSRLACGGLLDGHAFGQVARLIDVASAQHSDMVGKQLQRHDLKNRQQQLGGGWDLDDVVYQRR